MNRGADGSAVRGTGRSHALADGIAPFIVLTVLHASGAVECTAAFAFPGKAEAVLNASRLLWFALYLYAAVRLGTAHGLRWAVGGRGMVPLVIAVVLAALLSSLWSLDMSLTLQRVVHLAGTALIGIYIGYHFEATRLLSSLFVAFAILVLGGTLAAVFVPQLGRSLYEGSNVWSGLQGEKNGFGFGAFACALVTVSRMRTVVGSDAPLLHLTVLCVSMIALLMSHSVTSAAALIAAGVILAIDHARERYDVRPAAMILGALACVLLTVLAANLLGFDRSEEWAALVGRSSDLTGRAELWRPTWLLIEDNPLGYGYGALWFPRFGLESTQQALLGLNWTAYSAHNGFLQLASEIGLHGALLALAAAALSLVLTVRLHTLRPSPFVLLAIAFQVAFLIVNLTEAGLFVDRSLPWILYVALPLAAFRSYQRLNWLPNAAADAADTSAVPAPPGSAR